MTRRQRELPKEMDFPIDPKHLVKWRNLVSLMPTFVVMFMTCNEPIRHGWPHAGDELLTEDCEEAPNSHFNDSLVGMMGRFLHHALLMELAIFRMKVSAFVLVFGRMLTQLGLSSSPSPR